MSLHALGRGFEAAVFDLTLETRRRQLHAGCASKPTCCGTGTIQLVTQLPSLDVMRVEAYSQKSIGRRTRSLDHAHLITDSRNKLAMTS